MNITFLSPERNNIFNFTPKIIFHSGKYINLKAFYNAFEIYWVHLLFNIKNYTLLD